VPTKAQAEYDKILEEQYRRKLQSNFGLFVRQAWPILHPHEPLSDGWYIEALTDWAQAAKEGLIRRLIVNQPPRTLKSTIFSIMFPVWCWTTEPSKKFIFYSWSFDKLSVPLSVDRRRLIESVWYQGYWGHKFNLSYDENMKWMFSNSETGRMTVLTGATGIGGNFLVIDDPHNTEQAESDAERTTCVRMVRQGLMTRLDNPQSDSVIVVMQRLHDQDVSGAFLKDGGWNHLCLPAKIEQDDKPCDVISPRSGRLIHHRDVGDLLDPIRLPNEVLEEKKVELGSRGHAGQYQQQPAPPTGTIFRTTWWQWYDLDRPPEFEQVVISVDASFKGKETSDDVAVQAWGMLNVLSYLLDRDTRKMGFAATKSAIRAMVSRWGATIVLIEDKANGSAIIEELKTEFYVIPIDPGFGDKVARAEGCSPMVEAGTVYLPSGTHGTKIQTLAAKFPNADKDDIDALTQFLNWRRKRGAAMKWFEAMAKRARDGKEQTTEPQGIKSEHPTPQEVAKLAMEEAGMKVTRPSMSKQVKAGDLKKDSLGDCPECGAPNMFKSSQGQKCLKCGHRVPNPSREVNIG
jgi:predicted phage terminase large subunit-like protein